MQRISKKVPKRERRYKFWRDLRFAVNCDKVKNNAPAVLFGEKLRQETKDKKRRASVCLNATLH